MINGSTPFTIQTVVENAIVHGIRGNKDGKGTLFLRSYRTSEYHVVEVEDNGVGFDVSILDNSEYMDIEHKHIGLINIKKRLELMSKGSIHKVHARLIYSRVIVSLYTKCFIFCVCYVMI